MTSKGAWQDPSGISGRMKLVFQFLFTGALLYVLFHSFSLTSDIRLFNGFQLHLPVSVYVIIMLLFIVGSANAINFTDGLDGLLINVAIPTYFFFFLISDKPEVQMFSLVMVGRLLGLLLYNIHPARAFMGDTGSLAIGGSLSFLAVIEKVEILIPRCSSSIWLSDSRLSCRYGTTNAPRRVCSEWHRSISTSVSSTAGARTKS